MDPFTEEHSKCLLGKEWLIKIDSEKSAPYLFKFYHSASELACYLLITDTRTVWVEVLTGKRFARRWREINRDGGLPLEDDMEEQAWRRHNLDRLSKLHTLANIASATFNIVESRDADFALQLECDHFKWRWETYIVGPRTAADLLSKHLIMPLISTTHMAFNSADPVSELSEEDLQKAVDKTGRTARRTVDTHVKNALSNPRVATVLQRMTALSNFASTLPAVFTTAEEIDIGSPFQTTNKPKAMEIDESPLPKKIKDSASPVRVGVSGSSGPMAQVGDEAALTNSRNNAQADEESVTEPDTDEEFVPAKRRSASPSTSQKVSMPQPELMESLQGRLSKPPSSAAQDTSRQRSQSRAKTTAQASASSDDESSPTRPKKKAKAVPKPAVSDSSSDAQNSEEERRKRLAKIMAGGKTQRGGARQPVKRGARRF
ncbi:hypothetical protein OE88DRAFT_1682197 [Heliocybe sulcata]|uniref:XLF-like N-terminal domain-containing protein n=1 Tax=Heliocybe sulcata TaxID=5364 RepID=A0A5C3N217_9AGAM|nr:hypothetical protein OE88DRAFT_1682197 [Heliocybe sulcata]